MKVHTLHLGGRDLFNRRHQASAPKVGSDGRFLAVQIKILIPSVFTHIR